MSKANKMQMITEEEALPGRKEALVISGIHAVHGTSMVPPFPDGFSQAMFGMGCFWGAERLFWRTEGVYSTAVGYAAGFSPNPNYQEVCTGQTGHNEVVQVIFDPQAVNYTDLLTIFWQGHNPTQGMRQGNDRGTQYRSGIYVYDARQRKAAETSKQRYQEKLQAAQLGEITTEILDAPPFYYAEEAHQQYLHKNPGGYCGLGGIGIKA